MAGLLDRILTLNLIGTTIVFYVAARIYLLPHLGRLQPRSVLVPILLLHSLRHLGLVLVLLAGTVPFGAFFAERAMTRAWVAHQRGLPAVPAGNPGG